MVALMTAPRNAITVTRGKITHIARWDAEDGMVTVWLGRHDPSRAHLGALRAEVLAQLLVDELIERGDRAH